MDWNIFAGIIPTAFAVAPLVGAWIEIWLVNGQDILQNVAPLVGAWIEIYLSRIGFIISLSLLSWERGLKLSLKYTRSYMSRRSSRGSVDWNYWSTTINFIYISVAPLVGAWIEIACFSRCRIAFFVAPLVGAWIEIYTYHIYIYLIHVAPLVGAWIEITKRCRNTNSHTPSLLSWERGLKSFGKSKC